MSQYRQRPVVVEARHLGDDYDEDCAIVAWCGGKAVTKSYAVLTIDTPGGILFADVGDWVIRDASGKFDTCESDSFDDTYELIPEQEPEEP